MKTPTSPASPTSPTSPRDEIGAASAEYAAVTACGVGFASILIKLITSDWGQQLIKTVVEVFFKMIGIG